MFANSLGGLLLTLAARHGAPLLWEPSVGVAAFCLAAFLVRLMHARSFRARIVLRGICFAVAVHSAAAMNHVCESPSAGALCQLYR